MNKLAIASVATVGFIGLASQSALAHQNLHENSLVKLHNNISVAGGTTYQHYKEYQNGNTLDKETGWIPNFDASASYMSPARHYLLSASVRYSWGNTNYNAPNTSSTNTHNNIVSVKGKIGKGFQLSRRLMVTPFLTYGHRYWHRGLTGTASLKGYKENYNMNYAGAGFMVDYQATRRLILSAQAMGGSTFSNTLNTSIMSSTYNLGDKAIAKAALKADYHVRGPWHVFGKVHYTYFKFGHSGTHTFTSNGTQYNSNEPNSTTNNVSLDFGVRYTF